MIYAGTRTSPRLNARSINSKCVIILAYLLLRAALSTEEIYPAMTRKRLWSVLTSVAAASLQMRSVRSASALAGCYSYLTNGTAKVGANYRRKRSPWTRSASNTCSFCKQSNGFLTYRREYFSCITRSGGQVPMAT